MGNISLAPTTDSVTLLAQVSISPNETTIDLATVAIQDFIVNGTEDSYDWSIIEEVPDTIGETVAQFSGGVNSGNSVTVEALNAGSFKLQAGDALTSGTITVINSVISGMLGDVNDDGSIDSGDAILVLRYSVGLTTLTDIQRWAGNVTNKADNNNIDSGDAIKILRYSVGLITEF